jgi:hypothetical protein
MYAGQVKISLMKTVCQEKMMRGYDIKKNLLNKN